MRSAAKSVDVESRDCDRRPAVVVLPIRDATLESIPLIKKADDAAEMSVAVE